MRRVTYMLPGIILLNYKKIMQVFLLKGIVLYLFTLLYVTWRNNKVK